MSADELPSGFFANITTRIQTYISIWEPWWPPAKAYYTALISSILRGDLSVLWRPTAVGDATFAKWWLEVSHNFLGYEDSVGVPDLVASAHGVVLDLGAGSGNQLYRLKADKLEHVYGIEYNEALIPALHEKIEKTGLGGKYTPVVADVQNMEAELSKLGVEPGTVDCILSIQLLCSVPDQKKAIAQWHRMLKPGGQLIFWEHQENEVDFWTRTAQRIWTRLWAPVIGGCRLDQPTRKSLLASADWEIVELEAGRGPLDLMPRVWGKLKKRT